jgi:hypothetical protein
MDHETQPRDEDRDPDAPPADDAEREARERDADQSAPDATVPFDPEEDDDSALGDSDQHSSA